MIELHDKLRSQLAACPIVGIFRGVHPNDVVEIGEAACQAGLRVIEVPLNSPNPFESIDKLRRHFEGRMIVGGGTVLSVEQVHELSRVGAQISVSPNCDPEVIEAAIEARIVPMPGVATATEAFAAVKAGAEYLKLFPASSGGVALSKALREVLPSSISLVAVGGVSASNASEFTDAGCRYLGVGSEIYRQGFTAQQVFDSASEFVIGFRHRAQPETDPISIPRAKRLAKCNDAIGDSPVWDSEHRRLIWIDTAQQVLRAFEVQSQKLSSADLTLPIFGIGLRNNFELCGVSRNTVCRVDLETGNVTSISDSAELPEDSRLNHVSFDAKGRAWAGSIHLAAKPGMGCLYKFEDSGQVDMVADGFGICNGVGWNAERSELFLLDTLQRTLIATQFDDASGSVRSPRLVYDFMNIPGKPHGMVVDSSDHIWIAMWGGNRIIKINSMGNLLDEVHVPAPNVTACTLGGNDLSDLFVTSARFRNSDAEVSEFPDSGSVFRICAG